MTDVEKLLSKKTLRKSIPVEYEFETGEMVPDLTEGGKPRVDKVTKEPILKPETVKVRFVMEGLPDNYIAQLQLLPPNIWAGKVALYKAQLLDERGIEADYSAEDVMMGMLIQHYLSPKTPIGEMELAYFAKEHGPLYTALLNAAVEIMKNKGESPFVEAGVGNSTAGAASPAPSEANSSSSVSSQLESIPTPS